MQENSVPFCHNVLEHALLFGYALSDQHLHKCLDALRTVRCGRVVLNDVGLFDALTLSATWGDYRHSEIEFDGEVGTVFENSGYEARIEARQKPMGQFDVLWGAQFGETDFFADGEEAFILPVTIKQAGVFGVGRYDGGLWGAEFGMWGETRDYNGLAGKRSFDFGSASVSAFATPLQGLRVSLNLGRTERAPTEIELFADGPHAATGAFERGDPNLKLETATTIEAGLAWQIGPVRAKLDIWQASFDGFINFTPTGEIEDDLPLFETTQRDATLSGYELGLDATLFSGDQWSVLGEVGVDYVRGRYKGGDRIARIPPGLVHASLEAKGQRLSLKGAVEVLAAQKDVALFETTTPSATLFHLTANWVVLPEEPDFVLTLEGRNLTDEDVREHTSFLKDALPKPGRSVRLGLRVSF